MGNYMFVLYKKLNNDWNYADIWVSDDNKIGYVHTGVLGTTGKTEQINFDLNKNLNPEIWAQLKEKQFRDQGYSDLNESELNVVVLQFQVKKQLVDKVEKATDEEREEILSKIDSSSEYDKLAVALETLSFDNGFFPGFDGFDLGYNNNDKPVINIYLYGLDGKKYCELIKNHLINEFNFDQKDFCLAYALADFEDEEEKYTLISGNEDFSI